MNKIITKASTIGVVAFTSWVVPPVYGQQAAQIEEVIVTATRRETSLVDTPISISALSENQLRELNIQDVSNLNQLVPGLQIRQNAIDGQGSVDINLRGVGNSNYIETGEANVSFNIDGVYTARPQAALQLFNDIQRVEVSRGPQGTLSGRNATVGSINVVTNRPSTEAIDFGLETEVTTYNGLGYKGMFNLPLGDILAVRLNYARYERDSVYDLERDVDSRAATLPTDFTPQGVPYYESEYGDPTDDGPGSYGSIDTEALRVSAMLEPADGISWLVTYENFQNNALGAPLTHDCERADCEANLTAEQIAIADERTAFLSFRGEQSQEIDNYRSTFTWDIENLFQVKYLAGYSEMDLNLVQDLDHGVAIELAFEDKPWKNKSQVHDFQLSSNNDSSLQWVAGYFYFEEETDRQFSVSFFPFGFQVFDVPEYTVETQAIYGDLTYDFNDRLQGFFGLRHSNDQKSNEGNALYEFSAQNFACPGALAANDPLGRVFLNVGSDTVINTPECFSRSLEADSTDESFTDFRIGLKYDVTDSVNVYGSVASGHKAALQDQIYPITRTNETFIQPVDTEKLISYEIGSKGTAFDGNLRFAAAMFYMDYQDKQEAQFLNFGDTNCDLDGDGLNGTNDNDGDGNPDNPAEGPGCDTTPFSFDTIAQNDLNDVEFPDQVQFAVVNAEGLDIYGIELEATANVFKNGNVSTFLTYTDAEYKDFDYSHVLGCPNQNLSHCDVHNVSGNRPRSTPEYTFNLTYTHTFDFGSAGRLMPTINTYYRSEYYLTPENIDSIDPSLIQQGQLVDAQGNVLGAGRTNESELYSDKQDASWKVNLNITYATLNDQLFIDLFGNNIFDEDVISHVRIDTAQTPLYSYEDPAIWGMRLRYNFGG